MFNGLNFKAQREKNGVNGICLFSFRGGSVEPSLRSNHHTGNEPVRSFLKK